MRKKRTFFISDLHLEGSRPEIAQQFVKLLQHADEMEALYILGDLFEAWIGDDDINPFHQEIISSLNAATKQGLPIYYLHGNRDFLIGKRFLRATGCQMMADEEKIILYGIPILLMHGDTLCTRDIKYLKARKRAKNRFVQSLFLLLPLFLRQHIAKNARKRSLRHTQMVAKEIMDVTPFAVESVMQKHHTQHLIHGHTHLPQIHQLTINKKPAERIVLAAWHEQGSALIWDENGEKKFTNLDELF